MDVLVGILVKGIAVLAASYILPGVMVTGFWNALVVGVIIGIMNAFVKPVLLILTLPINILTLGLFTFVINALIILFVDRIVPGFKVDGFFTALIFAFVLSIVESLLNLLR